MSNNSTLEATDKVTLAVELPQHVTGCQECGRAVTHSDRKTWWLCYMHARKRHCGQAVYRLPRKFGTPVKYRPEYCQQIIDFFSVEPNHEVIVQDHFGNNVKERVVVVPANLPTLERFAANLGVVTETLWNWGKEYPDFFSAITRAKELQKDILVTNSLQRGYDSKFAIFLATNVTDLKNKNITEEIGERKVIVEHRDYVAERKIIDAQPAEISDHSVQV